MENSSRKNTRKSSGVRVVNVAIRTKSVNEAIADALRGLSAKLIADRVETNLRTVENWKQGKTGPQAKHVVAMLNDAELGPRFLKAAGLHELAKQLEINTLNRRIDALKADERLHQEEAHGIRQSMEVGSAGVALDRGSAQRVRDKVATTRGVVPRSDAESR